MALSFFYYRLQIDNLSSIHNINLNSDIINTKPHFNKK